MKRLLKAILIRIQILCASLGGLAWIEGFNLVEKSIVFIPIGFLCMMFALMSVTPIPFEWETKKEFMDGIE